MRYLFIATVVAWWGTGCATVPPAATSPSPAQVQEVEAWRRQYEEERARSEELAQRLAATEAAMEALRLERAEAEQAQQVVSEELVRAEVERRALEEHNAQLQARQRELAEMHEQMADVWFESALSRARRHSAQPEPSSPAPASPPAPASTPGGGQGASP